MPRLRYGLRQEASASNPRSCRTDGSPTHMADTERPFLDKAEQLALAIQRYIQSSNLQPGDRLGTEDELAKRFGVSRLTLREALKTLAGGRLIRASRGPGGGIFLARSVEHSMALSVSNSIALLLEAESVPITELIEARMMVEVSLAGLAAERATLPQQEAMTAALAEIESHLDDYDAITECYARFYSEMAEAAGNRIAAAIHMWTFIVLQPKLRALLADTIEETAMLRRHRTILKAVLNRNPAAARRAMARHIEALHDEITALTRQADRPQEAQHSPRQRTAASTSTRRETRRSAPALGQPPKR